MGVAGASPGESYMVFDECIRTLPPELLLVRTGMH